MEQFRQVGEILGSLNALMVLKHEILINQRQCCLLFKMLVLAFETVSEEIKQNLRLEERHTKWKALEPPMKELHRIFKEADLYIRHCLEIKDWWGKAISLHMNKDCVELHIYNLLCCFPVVIEAIESAAEISGTDQEDIQKRRIAIMKKYDQECDDPKLFQWKFGKQYLITQEICKLLTTAWREDRWLLLEKIGEKKMTAVANSAKLELRLAEFMLRKLNENETSKVKLLPSQVLVGSYDYYVKRRLGLGGGNFKEIHWLGENFALRTFYGDIEPVYDEISLVLSLSHPNVLQYLCAFYDEERKEGSLVMELMNKNFSTYMKEHSGQKKRIPFSIPVAVDIMLQIARGMEYLHSKKIYHGDLNPSNVLLKARNASPEGFFQAKVTGFGLTSIKNHAARSPKPTGIDLDIWLAPEVLAELEQHGGKCTTKYTEKADVYSFGMLCFELLNGKVAFSDGHLQGEKMARNIRAGERPLFSYTSPKYLANLTKKCWQTNPSFRPTFSSICRILRYIKKILVINPDHGHPDSPPPLIDYCDMEAGFLKKFPGTGSTDLAPISQIPFQLFAYKLVEKEKVCGKNWDLAIDGLAGHHAASMCDDEHLTAMDDLFLAPSDRRSVCSEIIDRNNLAFAVDQRSVISEIPHRKLFSTDQRSLCSESPGKTFSNNVADQRSVFTETPERKNLLVLGVDQNVDNIQVLDNKSDQNLTHHKLKVEIPDKAMVSKTAECKSASPMSKENTKSALIKVSSDPNLLSTEIPEKKLLPRAVLDHKPASCESSEGKASSLATGYNKLAEIPEKKILQNTDSIQKKNSISSKNSGKKGESTVKTLEKEGNSKNSEKKDVLTRKLKDTEAKQFPEPPKNNSPRSSPARMKKPNPSYSPASSPARMKKTNPSYSPASSPARDFSMCSSSPQRSTVYASKEYSSPLNPCTRCSRLDRQISHPPTIMSPQRSKIAHVSDPGSIAVTHS